MAEYKPETACFVFAPTSKEQLPKPYVWEPCGRDDFGPKCRRLKLPQREALVVSAAPEDRWFATDAHGAPKLHLLRRCIGSRSQLRSLGDVDGPTRAAIADDEQWQCTFWVEPKREGFKLVAHTQQPSEDPKATDDWGNPAMDRIELPDLLVPFDAVKARPLGNKTLTLFGGQSLGPFSQPAGVRALRLPPMGRRTIETDGVDLVWTFREPADKGRCLILRAAWKEDPAALEPPTLVAAIRCSELDEYHSRTAVGCGYFGATTLEGRGVVWRLKDGVAWHFPKLCAPLDTGQGCETRVMGFTCSEAFLAVGGREPNVFRVPLDAMPNPVTPEEPPRPFDDPDAGAATTDGGAIDAGAMDAGAIDAARPHG